MTDNAGNHDQDHRHLTTVTVDTTPPSVTSQTESVSGLTRSTSDTITVTATDANGVASVAIWDDATNTQIGNAALNNGVWSLTASNLSDGPHKFYAVVTDDAGNQTRTTDLTTVTVDTTPPAVTLQTESVSGLTRSTSDTITVTAADANGVASVAIWDDATNTQIGNATLNNGVWSLTASNLSDGPTSSTLS